MIHTVPKCYSAYTGFSSKLITITQSMFVTKKLIIGFLNTNLKQSNSKLAKGGHLSIALGVSPVDWLALGVSPVDWLHINSRSKVKQHP